MNKIYFFISIIMLLLTTGTITAGIKGSKKPFKKEYIPLFTSEDELCALTITTSNDKALNEQLLYAVKTNNAAQVECLLQNPDANPNFTDQMNGWPLLTWAVYNADKKMVNTLIDNGAYVDQKREVIGDTSTMWAAYKCYIKILKILINTNANVNAKDYKGLTVLDHAILNECSEAFELLLEYGANVLNISQPSRSSEINYMIGTVTSFIKAKKGAHKTRTAIIAQNLYSNWLFFPALKELYTSEKIIDYKNFHYLLALTKYKTIERLFCTTKLTKKRIKKLKKMGLPINSEALQLQNKIRQTKTNFDLYFIYAKCHLN